MSKIKSSLRKSAGPGQNCTLKRNHRHGFDYGSRQPVQYTCIQIASDSENLKPILPSMSRFKFILNACVNHAELKYLNASLISVRLCKGQIALFEIKKLKFNCSSSHIRKTLK